MGVRERESYRTMSNTEQAQHVTPASSDMLLPLLETLPGALFVVDDVATIVYANASAQAILGATREDVVGKPSTRPSSRPGRPEHQVKWNMCLP